MRKNFLLQVQAGSALETKKEMAAWILGFTYIPEKFLSRQDFEEAILGDASHEERNVT